MKITGFVLNARLPGDPEGASAFSKAVQWAQEGKISRIIIQGTHWPHAEANRAAFPKWKEALNPLGVKVGVQTWVDFNDGLPTILENITMLRKLSPELWCLDMESPPLANLGANCAAVMTATKPEPCIISYNVPAQRLAFDFRRFGSRAPACEIHGQCYDVDGTLTVTPAEHIESAFKPPVVWDGGGGPAWWYRVNIAGKWSWRAARGYNADKKAVEMRRADGDVVWADAIPTSDGMLFGPGRKVRTSSGAVVGSVFGMAAYKKIGWTVATTRPITPEKLRILAQTAHAAGMAVRTLCSLYTIENTEQAQIDALCGAI